MLGDLKQGEGVRIWNAKGQTWEPAMVKGPTNKPRSYIITTPAGSELCRNRQDIRKSPEVDFVPEYGETECVNSPVQNTQTWESLMRQPHSEGVHEPRPLTLRTENDCAGRRSNRVREMPRKYQDYYVYK